MQQLQAKRLTGFVKYLTEQEFEQIEVHVEDNIFSPFKKLCIRYMMYLGLRVGEAVSVHVTDFSDDFNVLNVRLEKSNGKIHPRVLPDILRGETIYLIKVFGRYMKEGFLFSNCWRNANPFFEKKKPHISNATIRYEFIKMRKLYWPNEQPYDYQKDGSPMYRISPHTLRHYAAYRYYMVHRDIKETQEILGHKNPKTTWDYIKAVTSIYDQKEIVERAFSL